MQTQQLSVLRADEGGLSPGFTDAEEALKLMIRSFEHAGLRPGVDMAITLDVAASELFHGGFYCLRGEQRRLTATDMTSFLVDLVRRYPIISIEDALDQDTGNAGGF